MINNFDINSKGLNIECVAFYDSDLARLEFEANFTHIDALGGHSLINERFWNVNIYAHDDADFDLEDLENWEAPKKQKIIDYIVCSDYTYQAANEDFKSIFGKPFSRATKSDLIEFHQVGGDMITTLTAFFKPKFKVFSTRGHSRGEYVEVIVSQNSWLYDEDRQTAQRIIDQMFWGCPITVRIELNGVDLRAQEHLKEEYNWDKSEFIKSMRKKRQELPPEFFDELERILPDTPDYN